MTLAIGGRSARWAAVLAGLIAAAVLGLAGEAKAAWVPPFSVSAPGTTAADPQVAADGEGDLIVAWTSGSPGSTAIMVAEHGPGASAVAVWRQNREEFGGDTAVQVRIARKHGGAAWETSAPLSAAAAITFGEPQVEVSGQRQIVGWLQSSSGTALMFERTSSGDFGGWVEPAVPLSETGSVEDPVVGLDSSGRNVAAWRSSSPGFPGTYEVRDRPRPRATAPGRVRRFSTKAAR